MKSNLPQHPCFNKCSNFRTEQCNTCLIAIEAEFLPGDVVVLSHGDDTALYVLSFIPSAGCGRALIGKPKAKRGVWVGINSLQHATTAELNAGCRLPAPEMQGVAS